MIKATKNELKIISDILRKFVPCCEVRVFGSRYNGNAKKYSDLDLAIVSKDTSDSNVISDMKDAFEESDLPYRVDLLDWNTISPEFKKVIEESGFEVLQTPQC